MTIKRIAVFLLLSLILLSFFEKALATTTTQYPNAAGTYTDFDGVTGSATHWGAVDETPSDDDTSYISTQTGSVAGNVPSSYRSDTFNFPDGSVPAGSTINSVTIYNNGRSTSATYRATIRTLIVSGGSTATGVVNTPSTTYTTYATVYNTNPTTGLAWTVAQIDALEIGSYSKSGYNYVARTDTTTYYEGRVTQVYVTIDYTVPTNQNIVVSFTLSSVGSASLSSSKTKIANLLISSTGTISLSSFKNIQTVFSQSSIGIVTLQAFKSINSIFLLSSTGLASLNVILGVPQNIIVSFFIVSKGQSSVYVQLPIPISTGLSYKVMLVGLLLIVGLVLLGFMQLDHK